MSTLKRWIITGVSFGAGAAVIIALIICGYLWYSSKQKPPKPWDTKAITAIYDSVYTEGENNYFVFYYTLQNNTDFDYNLSDLTNITLMGKLKKQKSLTGKKTDEFLKPDYPILIPAKQRIRFALHLGYPYDKTLKKDASEEEEAKYKKDIEAYANKKLSNLDGFVLFDELKRYQIEFSKGW